MVSHASVTIDAPAEAMETPAAPHSSSLGWYTVFMTALVAVMSQIDRGVLALFVQPMKRDFHLSDTEVSILLGAAFTLFYVVGGPPLSRLADRGVRRSVIAGCLTVWSAATALCGFAQNFWAFFASRAVIGASESGCGPASLSLISDTVPREKLPRAYAIYNSGFLGGAAFSLLFGGILLGLLADVKPIQIEGIGTIHNWQLVFFLLGIPGFIIALIFFLTVPEPRRKGGTRPNGYSMKEVFAVVKSQRAFHIPLIIGVLAMGFQNYGLIAWMPAFYERTYGWSPAKIGTLMGSISLVGGTIGLFVGAWLAEVLGRRRDDANLRVLFLAQALPIPLLIAAPLMPNGWLALGFASVGAMLGAMGAAGFNAALNTAVPNEMRSQINVTYFILQNAIAGSLGPTLVALATDYIAHSEADLRYVIAAFRLVLGPICAFALWKALRPYGKVYRQRIEEGALG
jgi:MFS family permease